jgi:hypothetical protein
MRLWKNYNLSLVLLGLFLVSWALQTSSGWVQYVAEAAEHGSEPQVFGPDGYFWSWMQATMENWQSEFLQLLTFVTLTSFLIHRGSPESKDGDDRLERKVDEIKREVEKLSARRAA